MEDGQAFGGDGFEKDAEEDSDKQEGSCQKVRVDYEKDGAKEDSQEIPFR